MSFHLEMGKSRRAAVCLRAHGDRFVVIDHHHIHHHHHFHRGERGRPAQDFRPLELKVCGDVVSRSGRLPQA